MSANTSSIIFGIDTDVLTHVQYLGVGGSSLGAEVVLCPDVGSYAAVENI